MWQACFVSVYHTTFFSTIPLDAPLFLGGRGNVYRVSRARGNRDEAQRSDTPLSKRKTGGPEKHATTKFQLRPHHGAHHRVPLLFIFHLRVPVGCFVHHRPRHAPADAARHGPCGSAYSPYRTFPSAAATVCGSPEGDAEGVRVEDGNGGGRATEDRDAAVAVIEAGASLLWSLRRGAVESSQAREMKLGDRGGPASPATGSGATSRGGVGCVVAGPPPPIIAQGFL